MSLITRQKILKMESDIEELKNRNSGLPSDVLQLQEDVAALELVDNEHTVDISALETLTASHTTDISGSITEIGINANDISALETLTASHTTSIATTASSLTDLEDEVADRVAVLRSDITAQQNITTQHATDIAALQIVNTSQTSDIAQNTADIATLQSGSGGGGSTVVFLHRYRTNDYNMTGGSQFIAFNSANNSKRGSHLEVSGVDGIKVLIAGWYRVSWSIAFRRMSQSSNSIQRHQIRTFCAVDNAFSASAGSFGSTAYLRSNLLCTRGHSVGHNLMYVQANEIIKIGANGCLENELNWNSTFTGTRLESPSTFQVELVSEDSET